LASVSVRRAGRGYAAVHAGLSGRGPLTRGLALPLRSSPIRSSSLLWPEADATRSGRQGARRGAASPPQIPATPGILSAYSSHSNSPPTRKPQTEALVAGIASRGGQRHWLPVRPTAGGASSPSNPRNRALVNRRSFPYPPRPESGGASPEFAQPAPATAPRDHIAKPKIFPGSLLQKVNSNSKSDFRILVNCIENNKKIRKM
jgi:hypothetical protein